ncbi:MULTISPECIES: glycoside hydrolase family 3 C-terminal domain-containing protein [Saccharibacillus]|uniref:glycoside hydrolase family 3 C-terminal domain-containing protein n=1 Tax=Saccharibacillus TaxID=456492 RepID=UPI00192240AB|nr:glycoside hydrolase family 3 C-terminal domain-containing protein [Saccharibacillus sp. WB 17]
MTQLYLDHSQPLEQRVRDLIARFTLEEKLALLPTRQAAVERLGVPAYRVGGEAAHGVAWKGVATVFPQPIGLSSTWNKELLREIGSVIGDEARSYHRSEPETHGLTLWAPTVDMERNPLWGRTEEAYGEDPHLTGKLAASLASGMQGDHPFYLKMVATLKHFFANNNEVGRLDGSSSVTPRNMREYYLEAFRIPFEEGGALSMMTAYNSINGTPAIESPYVQRFVKDEWKMDGFIVCDGGDLSQTVNFHKYHDSHADSVAGALLAGVDSLTDDPELVIAAAREALERRLIGEEDVDRALVNVFRIRFRLGQFDPEEQNPYACIPESTLCAPEHAELARRAAEQSVVLLKNDGLLPLRSADVSGAAVVGPTADAVWTDWYSGTLPYRVSILDGVRAKLDVNDPAAGSAGGERPAAGTVREANEAVAGFDEAQRWLRVRAAYGGPDAPGGIQPGGSGAAAADAASALDAASAAHAASAASAVRYVEGSDTVRLRDAADGGVWAVQPGADGVLALRGAAYALSGSAADTRSGSARERQGDASAAPRPDADSRSDASLFELTRWGWGQHTLQAHANGRFVSAQDDKPLSASADKIGGWFVKELFDLHEGRGGELTLRQWNGLPIGRFDGESAQAAGHGSAGLAPQDAAASLSAVPHPPASASPDLPAPPAAAPAPVLRAAAPASDIAAAELRLETVRSGIEQAAEAARQSDVAIVCVGNSPYVNGKEEIDRPSLKLPQSQEELIRAVHAANPRTVVVIVGSYPFALGDLAELVPAIVYTAHGGQEMGTAIADVLFGDAAPAGRLSMTWYRSEADLAPMTDYDIIGSGQTYQYFAGDVLYPFGHGLTYVPFRYGTPKLSGNTFGEGDVVTVEIELTNAGTSDSEEVPQLYVRAAQSTVKRPLKQLKGFERVHIAAGHTATVNFVLPVQELAFWDVTRDKFCVESGTYTLMIGASSADIRAQADFAVEGETVPPRNLYVPTRAENFDESDNVLLDEGEHGETAVRTADPTSPGELRFREVDLTRGLAGWTLRVRNGGTAGRVELRLGDADGKLLGVEDIAGAREGEWSTLSGQKEPGGRDAKTSDDPAPGLTVDRPVDLYVRLHGSIRLGELTLLPAAE